MLYLSKIIQGVKMTIISSLRHTTTIKVNKTILDICNTKKISIQELIRATFQFIYSVEKFYNVEVNSFIDEIIQDYQPYEYLKLSNKEKLIKTHRTKEQNNVFQKIEHSKRTFFLNSLMSLVINNSKFDQDVCYQSNSIQVDPIINNITLDFFTNPFIKSEEKLVIIESLLSKFEYVVKNNYVPESLFYNLHIYLFDDKEIVLNNQIQFFLFNEFKKIYFVLLNLHNVSNNTKSSNSIARKVKKQYSKVLQQKYNNNISQFILNEISIDTTASFDDQKQFFDFLRDLHTTDNERKIVDYAIMQYCFSSRYFQSNILKANLIA